MASEGTLSLESIKAKLQQLQMQSQTNASSSNLATPSSISQPSGLRTSELSDRITSIRTSELTDERTSDLRTTEVTDRNNTASASFNTDQFHALFRDRTEPGKALSTKEHKKTLASHDLAVSSRQGMSDASKMLLPASVVRHGSLLNHSHTQELTDRSISTNITVPEVTQTFEVEGMDFLYSEHTCLGFLVKAAHNEHFLFLTDN
jgi:hypothetical protein